MSAGLRVAIVGTGAIGDYLAQAIQAGRAGAVRLVALADTAPMQARLEGAASHHGCAWSTDVLRLPEYEPDIVIEAASPQTVRQYVLPLLDCGVDVLVMSAGALADGAFLLELEQTLQRSQRRLYVPSGAIGGLDVLRAAVVDGLEEVRLKTSKPPAGLRGAPWFLEHPLDLDGITVPTVLFHGSVAEAVRGFPQNVNVGAILNLVATGVPSITVEVVADPTSSRNVHEIYARGTFGEMTLRVANMPSANNPKTSHLACLSPIALLRRLSAQLVVGS
jgi:aspartate dehydrogenase